MLIKNVKLYTASHPAVIERGWIAFDETIRAFGEGEPPADYADGEVLDGRGGILTPGLIDAHTHLGICEDSLGFEGDDCNEDSEPVMPHLRALDAINPFDRCFADARAAGITAAAIAPGSANPIGGQICVLKTSGIRVDDMIVKEPAAIKFALGENPKSTYHGKNASPVTRMATAALIRETLAKAKRYADDLAEAAADDEIDEPEYDMKNEALLPLLRGEIAAHFHAHRADDIFTAIRIANEFNLRYVLVHCTEGHLIADRLAELGAAAIVGPNLCDRSKPELREQTVDNPGILAKAGVKLALTTDHPVTPLEYLPLCAAMARDRGLDAMEALRAVTIVPAELLGVADRIGSIEVGKDADLALFDGGVNRLTPRVEAVWIGGKKV
ncbi:MAG: amidohydrolase [Clostridia bacterium]|nr:amidohydrolase [Clostridia bacterium]